MDFSNDRFLSERLKKGDHEAFKFLVNEYHHKLCIYANSLVNNDMQAEDIVQNVLIRLWEKRKKVNPNLSIKSFLYKSVYNEFIDQYRNSKSILRLEKEFIEQLNYIVLEEEDEKTRNLIFTIKQLMEDLPPKCKEVFKLSKSDGLTNVEISEHLEISVKAVEAQITRGFRILRNKLSEKIGPILFFLMRTIKLRMIWFSLNHYFPELDLKNLTVLSDDIACAWMVFIIEVPKRLEIHLSVISSEVVFWFFNLGLISYIAE